MSRNYKRETEKRKQKVRRFTVDIDKDLAERFLFQLQKDEKPYSVWVRENIEKYLKKL